ncbi:MAG: daptide-type RiPP biosynthesis dehydogenase [Pseudonocardiaceae bacterium]
MPRRACPTKVYAGARAWRVARSEIGKRALFVVDANVAFDEPAAAVIRLDARDTDLQTVRALVARLAAHAPDTVVGVGGGSVLDVVKLACLVTCDPGLSDVLEVWGRRAGVIPLPDGRTPDGRTPQFRRILVATTIGTGVEVSPVACVESGRHKRIVIGSRLQPELAVLDPACTATLPPQLLREGVLEALLRIIGPVAGSAPVGGLPDAEAAMLVSQLVAGGNRFAAGDTGADARLAAAMLSAATHTGWALVGRETFAAKHWYLANELSTVLGLRKMVVTAALLPAVWTRIASGDVRYGDKAQLAMAWSWIDDSEPVTGLRALLRRWDLDHEVAAPAAAIRTAAHRAVLSWGGRLPMLSGLTTAEIEDLYTDALRGARTCSA